MITAKWDKFHYNQVKKTTNPYKRVKFLKRSINLLQDAIAENRALGTAVALREARRQLSKLQAFKEELVRIH